MAAGVATAVVVSGVVAPQQAAAAPASPSRPSSERGTTPDLSSPVPSADADAQAAARETAPPVELTPDTAAPPTRDDPLSRALAEAARTGKPVTVGEETTETSITVAQPDGRVEVQSAAGPVRLQRDGAWVDVDTTLHVTEDGDVAPVAVPGNTTFSGGGDDLLVSLDDGEGTSITMSWARDLPEPELDGDTATYRDVLPDVDLVLTATRLGFSQLLVVNSPPTAATAAALAEIEIPVVTTGATLAEGAGGEVQVLEAQPEGTQPQEPTDAGPGALTGPAGEEVIGTAAAPIMWDDRFDPRTDEPVAPAPVGVTVETTGDPVATSADPAEATLTLTPAMDVFTAADTVYPVTIDPTHTLGGLGDTFVQSNIANTPQGGSTELRTGTYDGGATVARSYLRFDVGAIKNRPVQGANLALFEFHSWSCSPRWMDIREAGDFDPNTLRWGNQPWVGGISANANVAFGYSASCPANWVNFNLTDLVRSYSNAKGTVMPLAVTVGDERDNYAWKKFNSGNAGGNVPTLTLTWDGNCDLVNGQAVCGAIRDKYYEQGGPGGYLGLPTQGDTPVNGGWFTHFQGGSIYWSAATGAHVVRGAIRNEWARIGWENSVIGFPITDEICGLKEGGCYNHFQSGSIYFSPATGAHFVWGAIRDKWTALGWENAYLGYPVSGEYDIPGGKRSDFQRGSIFWSPGTGAHNVQGAIHGTYNGMGFNGSYLGFPTSDEYDVAGGKRSDFQGGQIVWDATTGRTLWTAGPSAFAGSPGWGTTLGHQVSDTVSASVNVATGNMNLSVAGLTVPGIGGDRGIGAVYNSLQTATGSVDPTGLLGAGFRLSESPDVRMIGYGDGSVRYVDPSGRAAVYEWNAAAGRYDSPVGDGGTQLTRDAANNWVLTTLGSHRKQVFRASDGLMLSDTDRNGVAYTFAYDAAGKPTTITGTRGGAPISYAFGGTGVPNGQLAKLSQTVDGSTRTVAFGYDGEGRLSSVVDASGKTTSFDWTGTDITRITPPSGKATAVSYDTGHRVTQVVRDPGGINATTKLAYGAAGNVAQVKVTDPNDHVTTYDADAFGKVTKTLDALGHTKATTYSPNNDVATAADSMPSANTTTYSYNGADGGFSPTGATAPTGASASATYPASGTGPQRYLPTGETDSEGNTTAIAYDDVGNPVQEVSGGVVTSMAYNPPAGQPTKCAGGGKPGQMCTQTDGRGGVTTFTYDAVGNLLTVTPPAGVIKPTSYTYDGVGRPKTVTDGKGQVTTYVYDANDRVKEVRYGGATSCTTAANCEVYGYDSNGNLTSRKDGAGTTTYTYDALNRLSGQTSPAGSGGGARASTLTYDLAGNLTSFTDGAGTTRYAYDAGNNLVSLAEPGGSCTGTVSRCTTYTYNANDVRTKITYPGGTVVEMLDIDNSSRPLRYTARTAAGTVLMDFRYSFTGGNGDRSLVQSRADWTVAGTAVQTYSYDGLNRLTRALEKVGTATTASWTYCYDANGNRTFDSTSTEPTVLCPGQTGGPTATYSYDATDALIGRAGQPAAAFGYDGNGAELRAVGATTRTNGAWNTRGQLTSLTSNGTVTPFTYAGDGNKERLTAGGSGYQNTALGITTQTGTGASTVIREPNGTPVALRVGTASHYFVADRQGSIVALVDSAGTVRNKYSYDPYGVSRAKSETVANPWQYIGGQLDSNGLYHLQARYYDPTIGRFTQPDPSGREGNDYAYGGGNPVNTTDPDGEFAFLAPLAGAAVSTVGRAVGQRLLGGVISGFTKHGLTRAISRGVKPQNMLDAVRNPVRAVTDLVKGTSRYEGRRSTVVVNQRGCVVTCYNKRRSGETL